MSSFGQLFDIQMAIFRRVISRLPSKTETFLYKGGNKQIVVNEQLFPLNYDQKRKSTYGTNKFEKNKTISTLQTFIYVFHSLMFIKLSHKVKHYFRFTSLFDKNIVEEMRKCPKFETQPRSTLINMYSHFSPYVSNYQNITKIFKMS